MPAQTTTPIIAHSTNKVAEAPEEQRNARVRVIETIIPLCVPECAERRHKFPQANLYHDGSSISKRRAISA